MDDEGFNFIVAKKQGKLINKFGVHKVELIPSAAWRMESVVLHLTL